MTAQPDASTAPDGDLPTLHIRCGSDIRQALCDAGFTGDFLEYSNPYCMGPVPDVPDLQAIRARFISYAFGGPLGLSETDVVEKLRIEHDGLVGAATRYERVMLWFEHDSYDQLILARCLAQFHQTGAPKVLELVSVDHFPGVERFIGLGQLPAQAFLTLWGERRAVTASDLSMGLRTWDALRSDDPSTLSGIAGSTIPGLPDFSQALQRHLRELPWTSDGLSLTERLVLQILDAESQTIGRIFSRLMREVEPLPWLGDVMLLAIVEAMAKASQPVFTITGDSAGLNWPQRRLEITPAGKAVLNSETDWLSLSPPERWVGGVRIVPGMPHWCWDDAAEKPVRA
jgi:hypothetical protein